MNRVVSRIDGSEARGMGWQRVAGWARQWERPEAGRTDRKLIRRNKNMGGGVGRDGAVG